MYRIIIFALFLGSGLTGLVYQVVWTKLLALVFGVTLLAVSTVLTCFFGGLALGSFLGGRWIDKRKEGFKWYGIAEICVGIYALVFLVLLGLNNSIYASIAHLAGTGFYGLTMLKFVLSAVLLFIPTTLMGATLPILSKTMSRSESRFAKDIGGLYAINTAGAIIGTVLTAFFLIPSFGIKSILIFAGFFNIFIGASAVYIGRSYAQDLSSGEGAPSDPPTSGNAGVGLPGYFTKLLILGFALSGFTGLAYEVIWTRVLGFMLTGTVYAFAAVLAVFLAGIALGSFVFSGFIDRIRSQGTVIVILAAVEALIGISSIALITLYDKLPHLGFYARIGTTPSWNEFVFLNFLTAFITLILPTFLFGATFPLVCKAYSWRVEGVGTKIGNIYSVNTVGGIIGSFAAGFVLVPFAGMQNTIVIMGAVNVVIGAVFILANPFSKGGSKYAFVAAAAVMTGIFIGVLPRNMPMSIHKAYLGKGDEIVFYKEGAAATVMISERQGMGLGASNKRLWVNGNRATAAFYEGLQINRFQGVLPMVLHPDPKDVLVICFGSGTTFGTLSQFPVTMVDNVEIASTVIKGAPYFSKENRDVLHNPKSNIIIDDGRSYLVAAAKKYDVITEEPMHPSLAGVVNLYTKEYYELARAHLKPGGMMSQWIPLYNLSIEDVRLMVKTFQSVFPHTTVWIANTDIFMIGSPDKMEVDYDRVAGKLNMPNIKSLLSDIDLEDPYEFLSTFVMNEEMTRRYAQGADVMTDNMPVVEFTGPRSLNVNTISPNIAEFLKYREPVSDYLRISGVDDKARVLKRLEVKFAADRLNLIGRAYYAANNMEMAAKYFNAALQIDPADRNSLHYGDKLRFYYR